MTWAGELISRREVYSDRPIGREISLLNQGLTSHLAGALGDEPHQFWQQGATGRLRVGQLQGT
jgi:hypothetical protein